MLSLARQEDSLPLLPIYNQQVHSRTWISGISNKHLMPASNSSLLRRSSEPLRRVLRQVPINMAAFNYKQEYERYKKYYLSLDPLLNKPTNRAYTAVIFSFLAISLFGWYAIRPTMQTIFELKREIADKTVVDKEMEDKISALIEANATYENIQDDIPLLTQALPIGPDPIRAVVQLRGVASDSGVVIGAITVPPVDLTTNSPVTSTVITSAKINSIPMSLSISGDYPSVKAFLTELTSLRRIMQLSSLTFTPKAIVSQVASQSAVQNVTGTNMQVDLKLNVFYKTQ